MTSWAERWHDGHWLFLPLRPLSWLFAALSAARRAAFRRGWLASWRAPVPVIVVGNISVGGTGKTPLTLALVERLRQAGWRPGIVSRGYGGSTTWPAVVHADSPATEVGDEPLLLARRGGVPVVVDPLRARGVRALLAGSDCDLVICDDGLQHYALARDIEIAVIDGRRGFGCARLLPSGPLREPLSRLASVDFRVINGGWQRDEAAPAEGVTMALLPGAWQALDGQGGEPPAPGPVHAVAGIGHPPRFFDLLVGQGYQPLPHAFPDHHAYTADDLRFSPALPLVMTEKDAVKCTGIAPANSWYVPVKAMLPETFWQALLARLATWRTVHV